MKTLFLLMAQYDGRVVIPIDVVCRDYFEHLTLPKFLRKIAAGEIDLPVTRAEDSQKAARGVHVQDLADYIDRRRATAQKEAKALAG
ncbi:pyocin activator PrtN family protein [Methylobrevis pamukkalensis]|uniref:Pyocin activator protein PrtN n=1 Tax=Methylobrevis pamukkalensis TaxID=1439726 RepID=A0A1E3H793_9HYPH|nr:pyocin activator PrtN family protein [Methylobrevis pamukkalensis]ODN72190.1 Pyocin activator protein PrtN [Methylobrevis pamukkalensis]